MRLRSGLAALALASLAAAAQAGVEPEDAPRQSFRVLVYAEPDSFHYSSVGSVPAAIAAIERLGERHGFGVASRLNPVVFRSRVLRRYDAVVLLSPDGEVLDPGRQAAFERFVRAGGGVVSVHAASLAEAEWPFFVDLIGARFVSHPPIQEATLRVVDRRHPSTAALPRPWVRADEWYDFDRNPRAHVLVSVDETTYEGGTMGPGHPITWCRRFQGGRSWYTAMGHQPEAYSEPALRRHLLGGGRRARQLPARRVSACRAQFGSA